MAPDAFFMSISDKQLSLVAGADAAQQVVHALLVELFKHIVEQQQGRKAFFFFEGLKFRQFQCKQQAFTLPLGSVWEQLMGKTIAKYTDKIQIHGNVLYISTSMAPLKQELLFQKEKIKQRVNEALGENVVKDVVIK